MKLDDLLPPPPPVVKYEQYDERGYPLSGALVRQDSALADRLACARAGALAALDEAAALIEPDVIEQREGWVVNVIRRLRDTIMEGK